MPKTQAGKICDNVRYVGSTILAALSAGVIIYSIANGLAALPGHPVLHYILLALDLLLLAYLEGLQVAILALENVRSSTFSDMPRACTSHKLCTARNGLNVQRFLVGRQFFVVFVVFLCAQLTTYRDLKLDWMPPTMFTVLIETGLPGALIVLAFGQLMPQLICATHPITFMNLPGTWSVIQLCLCFETIGLTHFSWVLSWLMKTIFRMGTKEHVKKKRKDIEMTHQDKKKDSEGKIEESEFNMDINIGDADLMYTGAEDGLSVALDKDVHSPAVMRWLKNDSIRHLANAYGNDDSSDNVTKLPEPPAIVRQLVKNGMDVPRYLLPPYHEAHIPPHIVAFELIRRNNCRKNRNAGIKA